MPLHTHNMDDATRSTVEWLTKLALSKDAKDRLSSITRRGLTLPVMRAMGHEGLKELGIASSIDRAMILATEGDAPRPKRSHGDENIPRKTRTFEVRRANIVHVKEIDPIVQKFGATVLFEFIVRGGANDPDFWPDNGKDESDDFRFPYPPARWFWHNQVYLANALSCEMLERPKVVRMPNSDDLTCMFFATGEFQERFELKAFPFDVQTLTITLEIKCSINHDLPVEILVPDEVSCRKGVEVENFHKDNVWYLSKDVTLVKHKTGVSDGGEEKEQYAQTGVKPKIYPALKCSFTVGRRSAFYLWQLFVPVSLFSLLTIFVHFFLPLDSTELPDRLALTITFLLTSAAYKFVTVSLIPAVGYLTFADKYMTAALLLQCATVIQNCLLGLPALQSTAQSGNGTDASATISAAANGGDPTTALDTYNTISLYTLLGLWLLLHVVSIARASWLIYERTRQLGEVYHPSGHDLQVAVRKEKERVRAPSLHQATRKAASSRTLHTTAVTTTASGGRGEAEGESGAQARGAGRLEAAHQSTLGQRQSGNV